MTKTILKTELIWDRWYANDLRPALLHFIPKDQLEIVQRVADRLVIQVTCLDEEELDNVESLLAEMEDVQFTVA